MNSKKSIFKIDFLQKSHLIMSQEQVYQVILFQSIEIEIFVNYIGELETFFLGNGYDNVMELYRQNQQGNDIQYLSYDLIIKNNDIFMAFSEHPIFLYIPNIISSNRRCRSALSDWIYKQIDIDEFIYCDNEEYCQSQNYCSCNNISKINILRILPHIREYSDLL